MKQQRLGSTDLQLSVFGLGTWALGGSGYLGWSGQADQDSLRVIHAALDSGINWIDTAPTYGDGRAETLVGTALRGRREPTLVATKCGVLSNGAGPPDYSLRRKSIEREAEQSLARLGREVIDLYQIHSLDPAEELDEGWETLLRLQERGMIRWPGVAKATIGQLQQLQQWSPVAAIQSPYSLLRPEPEEALWPWARKNDIGIIAASPRESGILTDAFSRSWLADLPNDDWRKSRYDEVSEINYLKEPLVTAVHDWVGELKLIGGLRDQNLSELALCWVLREQAAPVTATLVGARTAEQLVRSIRAADQHLDSEQLTRIASSSESFRDRLERITSAQATRSDRLGRAR